MSVSRICICIWPIVTYILYFMKGKKHLLSLASHFPKLLYCEIKLCIHVQINLSTITEFISQCSDLTSLVFTQNDKFTFSYQKYETNKIQCALQFAHTKSVTINDDNLIAFIEATKHPFGYYIVDYPLTNDVIRAMIKNNLSK